MPDYKTPNGKIVKEEILREKYGNRFENLVSEGLLVLVEEDPLKKKEESVLPSQVEVTESIIETEEPDTSLVSLEEPEQEVAPISGFAVEQIGTPSEQFEDTQEKATLIERTFGKNPLTDFLGDIYRAGTQGLEVSETVPGAIKILSQGRTVSDNEIEEYIREVQEAEAMPETDEMRDFYRTYQEEGEGLFGVMKGLANNPSILPQILTSSITSMFTPEVAAGAGAGAGTGFLAGAGLGAIGGPFAGVTGAGGALVGMIGGATATLESALTFNELLKEELGDQAFTKENIRAILNDPEKLSRLRNRSVARGAAIGTVDAITGGIAGKASTAVISKTGRALTKAGEKTLAKGSKLAGAGTGLGVEAVGGSLGEVAGKAVAGQEMDVADIALEGLAGIGSAPITLGKSLFTNQPTYSINGREYTKNEMVNIINDMTDEDISNSKAKIIINNDPSTYTLLETKLNNYKTRQDAIQEQETGGVPDVEQPEAIQEVEAEVREPDVETQEEKITPTVETVEEDISKPETEVSIEEDVEVTPDDIEITEEEAQRKALTEDLPTEFTIKDVFLPTGKKIKDFTEKAKRSLFTARRFLPKAFYDIVKNRENQIQADMDEVSNLNREYNKIIKSIKDPTERQSVEQAAEMILDGENVEIRDDVKEVVTSMREMIDALSRKLLLDPTIDAETKSKIESNLGSYVTRSYAMFDDKNWAKNVSAEVKQDAKNYLRNDFASKSFNTTFDNLSEDQKSKIDQRVDRDIQEILKGKEQSNWIFGKDISGKDTKVTKQKKDIPLEIRMLMGEYTDVAQNFAKSVIKLSSYTNSSQMLRDIKKVGLQTGILKTAEQRTPEFNTLIKPEGSKAFEEIAGLYTTPEIANEFNKMAEQKQESPLLEFYFKLVALNKYGKTILSPSTHAVNFVSNLGFAAVNGYGDVAKMRNAYQSFRNLVRSDKFNKEEYNKYVRLGIIDKSVGLQEIKELFTNNDFESAILRNIDKKGNNLASKITSKVRKPFKFIERAYQSEDDFWKIFSFQNELERYSKAEYGKAPSELNAEELAKVEKIAADNVKKVMPSYDQIPDVIKKFRSVPVIGSFVSFQYESYRTALNTVKLAYKELKSENKALKESGAKRLSGALTYIGARNALLASYGKGAGLGIAGLIGSQLSDDDEKDRKSLAKRYLMEWQKNSDILPLKVGDGKFEIIDISGSDPHGAINKTINAMSEAESPEDAALKLFVEGVYKPFAGGEMTANLLMELAQNKKTSGAPIWQPEDLGTDKFNKGAEYIVSKIQPGLTKQIGQVIESEDKLKRIGGMATGLKRYNFDIPKSFKYKSQAFGFGRKLPNIRKAFEKSSKGKSESEQKKLYKEFNERYKDAVNEMHLDYISARDVFGVPAKELKDIMKKSGISSKVINQIVDNKAVDLPIRGEAPQEITIVGAL